MEGGATRPASERAVNCIPSGQNSHQGWVLGDYQKQLKKLGIPFNKGDQFVVSVDCDEVLGTKRRRDETPEMVALLERRDGGTVTLSGNGSKWRFFFLLSIFGAPLRLILGKATDPDKVSTAYPGFEYLSLPFGDLSSGTYVFPISPGKQVSLTSSHILKILGTYSSRHRLDSRRICDRQ